MPFITTYTIQTAGGPLAAYDYQYHAEGLNVFPLCNDGITPQPIPVLIPWSTYQGMKRQDTRTPADLQPIQTPAPIEETTPAGPVPLSRNDLHNIEGTAEYITVHTWEEADSMLRQWAPGAPEEPGCYCKVDFMVVWQDGENYTGRYDLRRHDSRYYAHLPRQIRNFITYQANESTDPARRAECQDFLTRYDIPQARTDSDPEPITQAPAPEPIDTDQDTPAKSLGSVLDNLQFNF